MPLSHTWMRNIHWTNMKEKYICPMHPVKRGFCLIILFLILGICFLSARAATGEISDHTDPPPHPTNSNCNANDWIQILILTVVALIFIISAIYLSINYKHPVPNPTNANCNATDWIHILILIQVGPTFIISAINSYINYRHWMQILILIPIGLIFIISTIILFIRYKHEHYDPVPKLRNANSKVNDWMKLLIPIPIGSTFIISTINLFISYKHEHCDLSQMLIVILVGQNYIIFTIKPFISYKGNHREQHDPEAGLLLEEQGNFQDTIIELQIHNDQLQNELGDLQEKLNQLQNELEKLQDENGQLKSEKKWRKARNKTDDITFDAGTAHPNLSISGDQKSFKHEAQPQKVPPNPERFDSTVCVLGSEGFSSGEHYWEVDVTNSTDWDLGVARKSIQRKGKLSLSPKEGFWALGLSGRDYWAKTDPWTRLMVQKKPKKIGIYLSCQDRQVTFFNVTNMSVLFTFNDCSFFEDVYPFFKNSHKETIMRLSSIKEDD